jgi:hypothetical protein
MASLESTVSATPSTPPALGRETAPYTGTLPSETVRTALEKHYNAKLANGANVYGPAWKKAEEAIRHLNFASPIAVALTVNPGSHADPADRAKVLEGLLHNCLAMSGAIRKALSPNAEVGKWEEIELRAVLVHSVAELWRTSQKNPGEEIEQMVALIGAMYADEGFAKRQHDQAVELMQPRYNAHETLETMESRLRVGLQVASLNLYVYGIKDARLVSPTGRSFIHGMKSPKEALDVLIRGFDLACSRVIGKMELPKEASNAQRSYLIENVVRSLQHVICSEYVAASVRRRNWCREAPVSGASETQATRIEQVRKEFPVFIDHCAAVAEQAISEMLGISEQHTAVLEEQQSVGMAVG